MVISDPGLVATGWNNAGIPRKLKTYSLSDLCNMSHLIDALETKALVILEREVEEATEPTGQLCHVTTGLSASQADDLLENRKYFYDSH